MSTQTRMHTRAHTGESQYALVEPGSGASAEDAVAGLDGARRGGVRLRVRARGVVVDGYEALRVDNSNVYAQLGASSSQPGPGKR